MISPTLVKELRFITSAPLMECKRALEEANGNLEEAKLILRKKGQILANKKSSREATEGIIHIKLDTSTRKIAMLKLACETDFVARNENFQQVADNITQVLLEQGADNLEQKEIEGVQIKDYLVEKITEIRENILISDKVHWNWDANSVVSYYVHHNKKIGTLVELQGENSPEANEVAKDLCLHIAANTVKFVTESEISEEVLEKEKNFLLEEAKNSGKPPEIAEKMVLGKMKKFKKEICLLDQPFLKNPEMSVQQYLASKGKNFQVKRFSKFNF